MVDREARSQLSTAVADLLAGRMTNLRFDKLEKLSRSSDPALAAAWSFCSSLYSSATLFSYNLTGRHAPDKYLRVIAERCVTFLQSDHEYTRHDGPFKKAKQTLYLPGALWIGCVGIIGILELVNSRELAALLSLVALLSFMLATQIGLAAKMLLGPIPSARKAWEEAAKKDTWPFDT
jgi:hypothetical protein